jgi:SAM-dependent methyltransferase
MSYAKILRTYKQTDEAELEFRFNMRSDIDGSTMKKIIKSVPGDRTLEQSINFISTGIGNNRICTLQFIDGVKQSKSYMSKYQLDKTPMTDGVLPYKLVLSHEKPISDFDVNLSKFARIKLRLSVRPKELPGWRLDFTLVRTVHNIKANLKTEKTDMLFPLSIDDFIKKAPWGYANSLEFEIEHIPGADPSKDAATKDVTPDSIAKVVKFVFDIIDSGHKNRYEYQKEIHNIASYIVKPKELGAFEKHRGIRDLYNRVWELNRASYFKHVYPNITDYIVTRKADGIRTLTSLDGDKMSVINGGLRRFTLGKTNNATVFDAEYIPSSPDADTETKANNTLHIFDAIAFNGENLTRMDTAQRLAYIPKIVEMTDGYGKEKPMTHLTENWKEEIKEEWDAARASEEYEVDGLVFTPKNGKYRTMKSWKWKPLDLMSIDFLVKKPPPNLIGVHPYKTKANHTMLFLFCGINKLLYDKLRLLPVQGYKQLFPNQKMYNSFPIQFSPSDEPYAYIYYHPNDSAIPLEELVDNVGEFVRTQDQEPIWKAIKIRTDRKTELARGKYFGNGFYVAEYTWQNYHDPLRFEDLIMSNTEFMNRGYFQTEKAKMYKHVAGFNSFVKEQLLSTYRDSNWLVDLASGQGQDMFRVSDANIQNGLFLDNDARALSELISRKHDFQRGIKRLNTRIYTKRVDLSTDYKTTVQTIEKIGVPVGRIDVIMCNFAIHYLMGTPESVRNLIGLIRTLLKPGGHFFFTAFDGTKIFELLSKTGTWDVREGEVLKYSIKKLYKSNKLQDTGQKIDVLLPFSNGNYYTEFLVNIKYLVKEFGRHGFVCEKSGSFADYLDKLKTNSGDRYKQFTKDDLQFVSLYSYGIFRKKPDNKKEMEKESEKQINDLIEERRM